MSLSRNLKTQIQRLSQEEIERLVQMGWEDRTPFEAIERQFGFSPNEFVKLMRHILDTKAFQRWRRRVFEQGQLKNQTLRGIKTTRFKCSRQSVDGATKGWK